MSNSDEKTSQSLPTLSYETVKTLEDLRQKNSVDFYKYVTSLRKNKWPLRAIADPLGVSRSIVAVWENKYSWQDLPDTEQLPPTLSKNLQPVYSKYQLTTDQTTTLLSLAKQATRVRRYTPQNSPSREAAKQLEDLLHMHKDKGASLSDLAKACGVSRRAIAQRLEKREG